MIEPYNAVGLIPTMWGISDRSEIMKNIDHLTHVVKAACWLTSIDLPVKLVAIPEGALQGFNDEVLDLDHVEFANTCAIDIPGPETEALGEIARQYGVYVMAQAKARHPEWEDRFFNVGFILDPEGQVILQHYKTTPLWPVEHSVCRYGRNLDAFWPVVDTDIGRLGIMMANEGSYPENARALAMNGAELVYRASIPLPAAANDYFEISTRARALDNNMYVLAPNVGTYYLTSESEAPIDCFGGHSLIADYRGQVVGKHDYSGGSSWVCGPVNIEALRHHRGTSPWTNWMKDLRTEMYQLVYEDPIYPKNLYLDRAPFDHAEYRTNVTEPQIKLMQDRDIWKPPASASE